MIKKVDRIVLGKSDLMILPGAALSVGTRIDGHPNCTGSVGLGGSGRWFVIKELKQMGQRVVGVGQCGACGATVTVASGARTKI